MMLKQVNKETVKTLSKGELKDLRERAKQLYRSYGEWRKNHMRGWVGTSRPISQSQLLVSYKAIVDEMDDRSIEYDRDELDSRVTSMAMRQFDAGTLLPVVLLEDAVCLSGESVTNPVQADRFKIFVDPVLLDDTLWSEEFGADLAKAMGKQKSLPVAIVDDLDADEHVLPVYRLVLEPVMRPSVKVVEKEEEEERSPVVEYVSNSPQNEDATEQSDEAELEATEKKSQPFIKSEHERIVGGIVYWLGSENNTDDQDEFVDDIDVLWKGLKDWMIRTTARMKIMHNGRSVLTPVVECFLAESDTIKGGERLERGDWYISCYIPKEHEELWQAVINGDITGFSMAGWAEGEELS